VEARRIAQMTRICGGYLIRGRCYGYAVP
jgi:hypothetical protein